MKRKVGFGIIGAGMIAELHAKIMQTLDNVELVGIFDTNAAAVQKRAEQFHSPKNRLSMRLTTLTGCGTSCSPE